jgi:hypothetical protein
MYLNVLLASAKSVSCSLAGFHETAKGLWGSIKFSDDYECLSA